MTETVPTAAPSMRVLRALAIAAFAMLVAFAVLSSHHDESAPAPAVISHTDVEHATQIESASEPSSAMLAAGGCAALALCCLVALALLNRRSRVSPAMAGHRSAPPTPPGARIIEALRELSRPNLLALSINRT